MLLENIEGCDSLTLSYAATLHHQSVISTVLSFSRLQNEILPEDVEGCDIASPFRDFMQESLRETNEQVKTEMKKTMDSLLGNEHYIRSFKFGIAIDRLLLLLHWYSTVLSITKVIYYSNV